MELVNLSLRACFSFLKYKYKIYEEEKKKYNIKHKHIS